MSNEADRTQPSGIAVLNLASNPNDSFCCTNNCRRGIGDHVQNVSDVQRYGGAGERSLRRAGRRPAPAGQVRRVFDELSAKHPALSVFSLGVVW
jgi:hypothetical protein